MATASESTSTSGLIAMQQLYLQLREQREIAEEELKILGRRLADLQANLAEEMAAIGQSHTVVDGRRLTVRTTPRVSRAEGVTADDLCEVLRHTEYEFLIKPAVNPNRLQAAMKEVIAETGGLPAEVAPLLRVWNQVVVSVTKT